MGMDVYGKNPTGEVGSYFRRNVWGWHPLWEYVETVHPDIAENVEYAHSNDGDGLEADDSQALAHRLKSDLANGVVAYYIKTRNEWLASLERPTCEWCEGTGIRMDEVGREAGMPTKTLEPELASIVGRTEGWCNGCNGEGKRDNINTWYSLEEEDIQQFAEFLENCGGFEIC